MKKNLNKLLDQLVGLHPKYIDLSLERLLKLLKKLDNPHLKLKPTIHIAGTNGKGSTLSYISSILQKSGYKVHSYTSPHLKSITERFVISNKQISETKLFNTLNYIKKINGNNPITFFEITTAAAFYIFAKEKADFVILETGLGGEYDATNVINKPIINIITPISIDHQEFLGKNLEKIAKAKLGIIKKSSLILIGKQSTFLRNYIKRTIKDLNNKKIFFGEQFKIIKKNKKTFHLEYKKNIKKFNKPNLLGFHQYENAAVAIIAVMEVKKLGYKITFKSINDGLSKTKWLCRLEKKSLKNIPVYLDGAHNLSGAQQLNNFFKNKKRKRWLVIGMMKNKDLKNYLLKKKKIFSGVIAIKIPGEKNSFTSSEIYKTSRNLKIKCIEKRNIIEANKYLLNKINPEEIVISGSLYLVGKVRNLYI